MFQLLTNKPVGFILSKGSERVAVRAPRHRNGAVVVLQRGPYGDATAMPLQTNGGLTARKRDIFRTGTATKNLPAFSFLNSREGLTGTKMCPKCVFPDVKLSSLKTSKGLTRGKTVLEGKFLQRCFCPVFYM